MKLLFTLLCLFLSINSALWAKSHAQEEHHNRYELELSHNNNSHLEFTGSVYYLPRKKIQVTADQSFHHFASVVVQELPFPKSKWGTFVGAGVAIAFADESSHVEKEIAGIVQSGLAYAIDQHWSPGFTVSPGYSFSQHNFVVGATLDLVYGF